MCTSSWCNKSFVPCKRFHCPHSCTQVQFRLPDPFCSVDMAADRTRPFRQPSPLEYCEAGTCSFQPRRANIFVSNIHLPPPRHLVLEAEVFHSCIRVETRRVYRSRRSVVLSLVDITPDELTRLISILSSSVRATDYIGWHEAGKRLGILFTEVETEHSEETAKRLTAKIVRVLRDGGASHPITMTVLPSGRNYLFMATENS